MEVDGMYENTPWERLSLVAPWFGLAALVAALALYTVVRTHDDDDDDAWGARWIATLLGPTASSLATLGVLFTVMWRPAHDTYPHAFGRAALWTGGAALAAGLVAAAVRLVPWRAALLYALPTTASCAAAAISAFSHSIIAEGQVTAMVVPVAFVFAAVIAVTASAVRYRDPAQQALVLGVAFAALAAFAAWKLPVVQFRDGGASSEIYPVTGSLYALIAGVVAGLAPSFGSRWWLVPGIALAGAAGYVMQMWFGVAIAVLGVSLTLGAAGVLPWDTYDLDTDVENAPPAPTSLHQGR